LELIGGHEQGRNSLYRNHRFPAEVIAHAIWPYFRFPLGLGLVEDPLERSFAKANGGFAFRKHGKTKESRDIPV
jgi:hypothetical protein